MDSITADQPATAETKTTTLCPDCKAQIEQTGFIVTTVHHQLYTPTGKGFSKSRQVKSYTIEARCALCGATLPVTAEALIGKEL